MNDSSSNSSSEPISLTAANWTVRRDRGLSASESIEYELWLAADPRHAAAIQKSSAMWSLLDRIPESAATPILASNTNRRSSRRLTVIASSLAAAAAIAVGLFIWSRPVRPAELPAVAEEFVALDAPRTLTLTDGSLVQLNTGGRVIEQFTATERRIVLVGGEAHFSVVKNPARPFIVRAGALQVRAVGTAFDINLQSRAVEVIVTEGRVQLTAASSTSSTAAGSPLSAGERAILHGNISPNSDLNRTLVRSHLDAAEMAGALSWREPLLRLGGATLAELAIEFERGTGKHLVFADPSLAELRFGGRFKADDLEGFTQVLATTLDLELERTANGTIILRRKNSVSR